MGFRIFVTGSGIAREAKEVLLAENCVLGNGDPDDTEDDIAKRLAKFDPDGLIVRQGKITDKVQATASNLKVICKHGVGTDNIDIKSATKRGIPVMFTPDANYESVAEHTLALILSLIRRVPMQDKRVRMGIFDKTGYDGEELLGKTLGLIGFGRVARRLSELVAPFNMSVIVYHPSYTTETLPHYISKVKRLEDLLPQADIISLHAPLTPDTKGLINSNSIGQMKKNVYLINTARGAIVNESDLVQALRDRRVNGAALDTLEIEPPAKDNPLFGLDNVILTTHIAGLSDNSFRNVGLTAAKHVLAILRGEPIDVSSLLNIAVIE